MKKVILLLAVVFSINASAQGGRFGLPDSKPSKVYWSYVAGASDLLYADGSDSGLNLYITKQEVSVTQYGQRLSTAKVKATNNTYSDLLIGTNQGTFMFELHDNHKYIVVTIPRSNEVVIIRRK